MGMNWQLCVCQGLLNHRLLQWVKLQLKKMSLLINDIWDNGAEEKTWMKWEEVEEYFIMKSFITFTLSGITTMIKSRNMRCAAHVACIRLKRNVYINLVGKIEDLDIGWMIMLKWMLKEIRWDSRNWIDLAHNSNQWRALINMVMNLQVPQNVEKFLSSWATIGISIRTQPCGVPWFCFQKQTSWEHFL